jgi:hypothetical protein
MSTRKGGRAIDLFDFVRLRERLRESEIAGVLGA